MNQFGKEMMEVEMAALADRVYVEIKGKGHIKYIT